MRCNIAEGHRGLRHSDKSKREIGLSNSIALKGRKLSEEHKRKISEYNKKVGRTPPLNSGKKHWHWKGGITPLNRKIRGSKEYAIWRRTVLERDGFACIECGTKEQVEADHIKSFFLFPEIRFDVNNGRTLCRPCHTRTDTYARR